MYTDLEISCQVCRPGVAACTENLISTTETKEYVARGTLHNPVNFGQLWPNTYAKVTLYNRVQKYYERM
ncbi:MAG TPA: hypothetical protein VK589_20075 [Chryseolinea sp.]|nr:hypothetical protein [Chryseolinea sp.]